MAKLYCTICSKDKRADKDLLPAIERYISERINKISHLSKKDNVQFVILSGKFGLLKPDEQVPFYDHLLTEKDVTNLSKKVAKQLLELEVDEIIFFAKPKRGNWEPYYKVIEEATNESGIKLITKEIDLSSTTLN